VHPLDPIRLRDLTPAARREERLLRLAERGGGCHPDPLVKRVVRRKGEGRPRFILFAYRAYATRRKSLILWRARRDSNSRPLPSEGSTLSS
jgi:hypothetical protein